MVGSLTPHIGSGIIPEMPIDPGWMAIIESGALSALLAKIFGSEQEGRFIHGFGDRLVLRHEQRSKTKLLGMEQEEPKRLASQDERTLEPRAEKKKLEGAVDRRAKKPATPRRPGEDTERQLVRERMEPSALLEEVELRRQRELGQRTRSRIEARDVERQENLEAVFVRMITEPPPAPPGEPRRPLPAVINRIIDGAAEAAEEEMQVLWARLLAHEVVNLGRFSLRTLDVVRSLSRDEAQLFMKVCRFAALDPGVLLTAENLFEIASGITYAELVVLREAGLLSLDLSYRLKSTADPGKNWQVGTLRYFDKVIALRRKYTDSADFAVRAHVFTTAGRELGVLAPQRGDPALLREIAKWPNVALFDVPFTDADLQGLFGAPAQPRLLMTSPALGRRP
jgi:hypothetical protein